MSSEHPEADTPSASTPASRPATDHRDPRVPGPVDAGAQSATLDIRGHASARASDAVSSDSVPVRPTTRRPGPPPESPTTLSPEGTFHV